MSALYVIVISSCTTITILYYTILYYTILWNAITYYTNTILHYAMAYDIISSCAQPPKRTTITLQHTLHRHVLQVGKRLAGPRTKKEKGLRDWIYKRMLYIVIVVLVIVIVIVMFRNDPILLKRQNGKQETSQGGLTINSTTYSL